MKKVVASLLIGAILSANLATFSVSAADTDAIYQHYVDKSVGVVMIDNEEYHVLPGGTLLHSTVDPITQRRVDEIMELESVDRVRVGAYRITVPNIREKENPVPVATVAAGETYTVEVEQTIEAYFEFESSIDVAVDAEIIEAAIEAKLGSRISDSITVRVGTVYKGPEIGSGYSGITYYLAEAYDLIEIPTSEDRTYRVYQLINGKKVYNRSETHTGEYKYEAYLPKAMAYSELH